MLSLKQRNVGKEWNKFVLLPKIKNDQNARENNFQKQLKIGLTIINYQFRLTAGLIV